MAPCAHKDSGMTSSDEPAQDVSWAERPVQAHRSWSNLNPGLCLAESLCHSLSRTQGALSGGSRPFHIFILSLVPKTLRYRSFSPKATFCVFSAVTSRTKRRVWHVIWYFILCCRSRIKRAIPCSNKLTRVYPDLRNTMVINFTAIHYVIGSFTYAHAQTV